MAVAGLHIEKVVEKSLVARHAGRLITLRSVVKKAHYLEHALTRCSAGDILALDADRICGQRKAHRRDTGEGRSWIAVRHKPGIRIGVVPEVTESPLLQRVE